MNSNYSITVDIDWAPDFCISQLTDKFVQNKIKCTWFVTHDSPAVKELYKHPDLFEMGIHPNFFPGSTHGKTEAEVLDHIMKIVPGAKTVRTHALYQSSRVLNLMNSKYGIETDCSMLLYKTKGITPHSIKFSHTSPGLFRIPFFWEDDIAMYDAKPNWKIEDEEFHPEGLKIFNFHPVFVYLNGASMLPYEEMKKTGHLSELKPEQMKSYVNKAEGCGTFLENLISFIKDKKLQTSTASEIKKRFGA